MKYLFIPLLIALHAYALWRTWTSDTSGATALIWTCVIVLLPFVGVAMWMLAGPKFRSTETDPDRKI